MTQRSPAPTGLARFLPILNWSRSYDRAWLRADLVAGLAVAALVVPKSLGYAGIAGVPIQHGLYAAAAGTILYALFGTAKQISTGPSSALAAVAGSAVVLAPVSGDEAVELVAAITVITGLAFLLLAVLKMGWISQFLSKAVITGFLFGAAIEVVVGELPKITGTGIEGSNAWRKFGSWLESLGDTSWETLLVGVVSLLVIFGIRFSPVKWPGALVLMVGGPVVSVTLDFEGRGIVLVGDVPRGFVAPAIPDLDFVADNFGIIDAVVFGMMDVAEMIRLRRVARVDFRIALGAIVGVLTAGVLAGVIIGVVLSLVWLVYIASNPNMPVLGRRPGTQVFRSVADYPDGEVHPGLLVMRFDAGLFFASSDALEDRLRELAQSADTRYHTLVLSFEGVDFIDSQGAEKLSAILDLVIINGAELRLARVKPQILALLGRDGFIDKLGVEKLYGNIYNAIEDKLPESAKE